MRRLAEPRLQPRLIATALLGTGAFAWWATLQLSSHMALDPAAFVGIWTLMMLAMMAPSVLPTVLVFATSSRSQRGGSPACTPLFVAGYLISWGLIGGVVAFGRALVDPAAPAWARPAAAGALALAGIYQLTSWKKFCLTHCRSPFDFFLQHWRSGAFGALFMGVQHGFYCVGCCIGLMAALVTLGMMSPVWMSTVALVILLEKVVPYGDRLAAPVGVMLIAAGIAVGAGWWSVATPMGGM